MTADHAKQPCCALLASLGQLNLLCLARYSGTNAYYYAHASNLPGSKRMGRTFGGPVCACAVKLPHARA